MLKCKGSLLTTIRSNYTKKTFPFYNCLKKGIYYDNLDLKRNIEFVLNLGYNDYAKEIKSNMSPVKVLKYTAKRKLVYLMKHYYKHLLESIETGEIQIFDEILEKRLKHALYLDFTRLYENKCTFKLVNKDQPIFIKFLNVFEMQNVNLDRELNGEISEYDLKYSGSKILINKEDENEEFKIQTPGEIMKEREEFEKSDYKQLAMNKLLGEARISYAVEYLKTKLGSKVNEKNSQYISQLIEQLETKEKKFDPYSIELKTQFADYYVEKEDYVNKKVKSTDLYQFFRVNMPSHYDSFSELHESKKSFMKRFVQNLRHKFFVKNSDKSKKISKEKTLFVVDVEITSKMRLEVIDEDGNNLLNSYYNYDDNIKRKINYKPDSENYDTSLYNFTLPERQWNINHPDYMQSHVIRFEFEQKNVFQNIFKKPYNKMLITDIDFCLKGNKHFKFDQSYLS